MQQKAISKKTLVISAIALVLVIGLFATAYSMFRDKPVEGEKLINITVVFSENNTKDYEINTDAQFLKDAMIEKGLITQAGLQGGFVVTVDGVTADSSKEEWWSFSKGGEMLMTGISDTPISDGDSFEITLMTGFDSF